MLYASFWLLYVVCFHEGVRYFMRGLDSDGHVANYIETEQIVMYHEHKASFVQVYQL